MAFSNTPTHCIQVTCGTLLLMAASLYNGFPFLYFDTATYISSGFIPETPIDRPITYGLFLRAAGIDGLSVWGIVFLQNLILSWLLWHVLLWMRVQAQYVFLPLMLTTVLLTGVSWMSGQIMPDVFTANLLLSFILILLGRTDNIRRLMLYAVFFLSTAMHVSHLLFNGAFLLLLVLLWKVHFFSIREYLKPQVLAVLFLLTVLAYGIMASALSKSGHIFTMGTLVESGILKKFLDENCAGANYELCMWKDSLPKTAIEFIWNQGQPVDRMGWKESKAEFREIIRQTWMEPKYFLLHIQASVQATGKQLIRFGSGEGWGAFGEENGGYQQVKKYFPYDRSSYLDSKQKKGTLQPLLTVLNKMYFHVVLLGCPVFFLMLINGISVRKFQTQEWLIVVFILSGILINAWVNGTFANAINRLGTKVMWLFLWITLVLLFRLILPEKKPEP